jgi:NADPH:quinone reductase-like Zn-dependent oxidoreductase
VKALALDAIGGLEHLAVMELAPPELATPNDVRVRMHAAALNRLDLFVADGLPGITPALPHIVGSDGAGVVE